MRSEIVIKASRYVIHHHGCVFYGVKPVFAADLLFGEVGARNGYHIAPCALDKAVCALTAR